MLLYPEAGGIRNILGWEQTGKPNREILFAWGYGWRLSGSAYLPAYVLVAGRLHSHFEIRRQIGSKR